MGRSNAVLWVPLLAMAPLQALACYTVYDGTDRVVYYGDKPPVDMSRPLHETVPARFPDGHMVFDTAACPAAASLAYGAVRATDSISSPLLTDERTARAMKAPYRQLERGVVVVDPKDARMKPGVNVLPAFRMPARAVRPSQPMQPGPEFEPQFQQQPPFQPPPRRY